MLNTSIVGADRMMHRFYIKFKCDFNFQKCLFQFHLNDKCIQ